MSLKTQAVIASKRLLLPPRFVFWLLFFCPQAVRAWGIMADFEQLILLHSRLLKWLIFLLLNDLRRQSVGEAKPYVVGVFTNGLWSRPGVLMSNRANW